jgi:hypothetical protein
MRALLWVLQVLLALVFLAHGLLLLFPPAAIADQMNASLPRAFWVFLGVAEVLAAVGLTLPGISRIQPWLVPLARCRSDDRDDRCHDLSQRPRRIEFRNYDGRAASTRDVPRVHAVASAANRVSHCLVGVRRVDVRRRVLFADAPNA